MDLQRPELFTHDRLGGGTMNGCRVMDGIRGQRGFSLVELLVVMTIFIILIAMSSYAFNNVLRQ